MSKLIRATVLWQDKSNVWLIPSLPTLKKECQKSHDNRWLRINLPIPTHTTKYLSKKIASLGMPWPISLPGCRDHLCFSPLTIVPGLTVKDNLAVVTLLSLPITQASKPIILAWYNFMSKSNTSTTLYCMYLLNSRQPSIRGRTLSMTAT